MPDLRHIVAISAPPETVYAMVATQAGMRSWWTADTEMEERVGGSAAFGFDRRTVIFRMTVATLDPPCRVVLRCHGDQPEWSGTTLSFDVSKDEEGASLIFVHGGWRELTDFCSSCNAMWGNLIYRLKDAAEGNGRGPQWIA